MYREDSCQLGRTRCLGDDVVALGFQHEAQEAHACGSSFAYDDPDPVSAHLPPKERWARDPPNVRSVPRPEGPSHVRMAASDRPERATVVGRWTRHVDD